MALVATAAHSWAIMQKPAKNEIQKIREIDLQRKLCEFAETRMEKLVKSPWANSCFGGFSTLGTTVRRGTTRLRRQRCASSRSTVEAAHY